MKKFVLLAIPIITVAALAFGACASPTPTTPVAPTPTEPTTPVTTPEKEQTLRAESYTGLTIQEKSKAMFEEITKATGNKIKFEYTDGTIGKLPDAIPNAGERVLDFTMAVSVYTLSENPYWETLGLPREGSDPFAIAKAVDEIMRQEPILSEFTSRNVVPMLGGAGGSLLTLVVAKPIDSLDDLKGLKARGPTAAFNKFLEQLGMTPVSLPGREVYDALDKGVIEAALTTLDAAVRHKWYEPTETLIILDFGAAMTENWIINKDLWDSFLPATRDAIDAAAVNFGKARTQVTVDAAEGLINDLRTKYNRQVYIPDAADLETIYAAADAARKVYFEEWSEKGYETESFYNRWVETVKKYEK